MDLNEIAAWRKPRSLPFRKQIQTQKIRFSTGPQSFSWSRVTFF